MTSPCKITDSWQSLRRFTQARISLGRAGISVPTQVQLKFNVDHALARDAVWLPLDVGECCQKLDSHALPWLPLHSQVSDRREYLQRPDLGRRLNPQSNSQLIDWLSQHRPPDVALVLVDGLSSTAVHAHGSELAEALATDLNASGLSISPVCLVEQGRVAIGDDIGEALQAKITVLIVGERPGLSSPDSLGIYLTYAPKTGRNDAQRNCISNVRPAGLSIKAASTKCVWLVQQALQKQLTGVELKDTSETLLDASDNSQQVSKTGNFLLK